MLQIFPLEPIQDNDNYKPHAKHYSNLSMFTKLLRKQESVTDGQTAAITISSHRYRRGIIIKSCEGNRKSESLNWLQKIFTNFRH